MSELEVEKDEILMDKMVVDEVCLHDAWEYVVQWVNWNLVNRM